MADAQSRRSALSECRVCRFCLAGMDVAKSALSAGAAPPQGPSGLSDMFGGGGSPGAVPLPIQVMACVSLEVFPADGMPSTICNLCRHFMDQSYKFKQICKQADEGLRHYVSQGELPGPIQWPVDLLQYLPESLKNIEVPLKEDTPKPKQNDAGKVKKERNKTPGARPVGRPRKNPKVETPSTVKAEPKLIVTKVDVHEEGDDEEAPSTKIKVTQLGDEVFIATDDEQEQVENEIDVDDLEKDLVPTGVYPCNECQRSFPLLQLRDIHIKQNHTRERKFACSLCDRAFYSKYDLQKHEDTHSGVKQFHCGVCGKSFLRQTMLQRHLKVHTSTIKYLCSHCDQTFLSSAELSAHVERRHSKERPFACTECPKKFAFKQGLERHFANQHGTDPPFKCDYCKKSFPTAAKLMRHIQSHAGQRPYPCKFCPKSFVLSHHYTRHLRTKHLNKNKHGEQRGRVEGVFGRREDCYKCSQCDKTFCTQDELIFHSAIHATQDLICPLCNEKFDDVDGVTTHIKSHIEGEQFLCDWCEFLFTSEDKLDMHIDSEHQEVMTRDVYKEIQYLEENDENEGVATVIGNTTDEEDELYESTQQAEALKESSKINDDEEEVVQGKQIEVEIDPDGSIKIKHSVSLEEENNEGASAVTLSDDENILTYTELKPVKVSELSKKPTEIVHKQMSDTPKTSVSSKVDHERKIIKSTEPKRRPLDSQVAQPSTPQTKTNSFTNSKQPRSEGKIESEVKETQSRTSEKSLLLLEKDINELQKNAKLPSPQKFTSNRFTPYKSILQRKDDKNRFIKSSMPDRSPPKTPRKLSSPIESIKSTKSWTSGKNTPEIKRERVSSKLPSESSMSEDEDDSDNDSNDQFTPSGHVRRSTRPSKVKDYAALIRDGDEKEEYSESNDEERLEDDELEEQEYKPPTLLQKDPQNKVPPPLVPGKRGRGRPRKNPLPVTLPSPSGDSDSSLLPKRGPGRPSKAYLKEKAKVLGVSYEALKKKKKDPEYQPKAEKSSTSFDIPIRNKSLDGYYPRKPLSESTPKRILSESLKPSSLISPSGQKLKMLPAGAVKSLPPGVKPLPLPPGTQLPPGVRQMKIGERVVRVQKIVMTKAELDAIQKKGLIEMKDGAMVLKAGVKLPKTGDNKLIKSTLLHPGDDEMENENRPPPSKMPKLSDKEEKSHEDSISDKDLLQESFDSSAQSTDFIQESADQTKSILEPHKGISNSFKSDRSPKPTRFEDNSDEE